jgi:predicted RNA-binding protein with PUA-like domain
MAYWLMKSEPETFSWHDLVAKGAPEEWHSVRNYTARNNMKAMTLDDRCFFYHSVQGREIVGIMRPVRLAHPDSTAAPNENGKVVWECVDVLPETALPRPVTLEEIKRTPALANMALIRLSRLSVQPVTPDEWSTICRMGGL